MSYSFSKNHFAQTLKDFLGDPSNFSERSQLNRHKNTEQRNLEQAASLPGSLAAE